MKHSWPDLRYSPSICLEWWGSHRNLHSGQLTNGPRI